jgi:hypothetical protein
LSSIALTNGWERTMNYDDKILLIFMNTDCR